MKAILVDAPGGPEQLQLQECPTPKYGDDEILVEMKVAGLNYIDIYFRTGLYKPPHYPYIPGKEGSGIVAALGKNVKTFKPGDRVAFAVGNTGSYAEYAAIPADQVVLIPDSMNFETAAACMLQGLTAFYLSHQTFPLKEKHTALIHAGAGGVGLLLIQMAKMLGAKVITTVSNEEKAKHAKAAGADHVVIYTQESFPEAVMKFTHGQGVQVVYDAVGKTTFNDSLNTLALRGMLVSYGQASGSVPPLDVTKLSEKSLYLTRPVLMHYIYTRTELEEMAAALFQLITQNKLKIKIGQRYSLADAAKAQADLEARKTLGKSILIIT